MIHWDNSFQPGMSYVMLGRTQQLDDIYIIESKDKFSSEGIRVDEKALEESNIIDENFNGMKASEDETFYNNFSIAYLNVLGLLPHLEDVKTDPFLEKFDVLSFGETSLNPDNLVEMSGYYGCQINSGKGKGLATYVKDEHAVRFKTFSDEKFSATLIDSNYLMVLFVYISKGVNWEKFIKVLDTIINDNTRPMAIMGDMNFDPNDDSPPFKQYMLQRNFGQLVKFSTHDCGRLLDHVYVNDLLLMKNPSCSQRSIFYSDHDIITLHVCKD